MFTVKFYTEDGYRQVIKTAESFTILRGGDDGGAEITLHQKSPGDSCRIDIGPLGTERPEGWPPLFQKAIIENAAGRTTEIIASGCVPKMAFAPKRGPTTQDGKPWAA